MNIQNQGHLFPTGGGNHVKHDSPRVVARVIDDDFDDNYDTPVIPLSSTGVTSYAGFYSRIEKHTLKRDHDGLCVVLRKSKIAAKAGSEWFLACRDTVISALYGKRSPWSFRDRSAGISYRLERLQSGDYRVSRKTRKKKGGNR